MLLKREQGCSSELEKIPATLFLVQHLHPDGGTIVTQHLLLESAIITDAQQTVLSPPLFSLRSSLPVILPLPDSFWTLRDLYTPRPTRYGSNVGPYATTQVWRTPPPGPYVS